ncbi:MAG: DUF2489 domain-containing protein [Halopseudomonas sp.]|uniref:DUF2489 domain-containing protein n=1 Tax=Halopseudomonas sp. TaxID=2901191 RepID=UPI00300271AA
MQTHHWLLLAGLLVIVALSGYACYLWRRVWRIRAEQQAQQEERNARLAADIQFLAQSLVNGQVPLIEGSIRIKVLLDNYSGPRRDDLELSIFTELYDQTAHIPTHAGWKQLSAAERKLHQRLMETVERDHQTQVQQTASQLANGLY